MGLPDYRPNGTPLGRALLIRPGIANDDLRAAVAAIERVHGDGALPPIPVLLVSQIVNAAGQLSDGRFTFRIERRRKLVPIAISIRYGVAHLPFVLVHEVGHFLDACGLPGSNFSSGMRAIRHLDRWRSAVAASRAVGTLRSLAETQTAGDGGRVDRLVRLDELGARSYAQFVALRSGYAALQASLDQVRQRRPDAVYHPLQWDDDDFIEIDRAIEELFWRLGWMASESPKTSNGRSRRS
jgi:hypothetical protein